MNQTIGAICLAAGIVLLLWGYHVSQSVDAQVKDLFTGSPTDKAIYLYLGGAALLAVGIVQLAVKRK